MKPKKILELHFKGIIAEKEDIDGALEDLQKWILSKEKAYAQYIGMKNKNYVESDIYNRCLEDLSKELEP